MTARSWPEATAGGASGRLAVRPTRPRAALPCGLAFWRAVLLSATLAGCSGGNSGSTGGFVPAYTAESVHVYRADSPWADALEPCVFVETVAQSCTLAQLPFISADGSTPSVEQVMQRLLVSHDWMAIRFEEVLTRAPPDLLRMFGSTTAILIGSEVRPSFYYSLNAAIQLDPLVLWQTVAEKRTISTVEDFRTDFGLDLQFQFLQRSVINGEPAVSFFSLADDSTRTFEDIQIPVMQLLYHELTHAIDAMPIDQLAGIDPRLKAFEAIVDAEPGSLSRFLIDSTPLASTELSALAAVRFRGFKPDETQRGYRASDAGRFIADDGAMKFYSYLSSREDVATLVEAALMKLHYNVDLNTAAVDKPSNPETAPCSAYLVGWGVRNRLADTKVAQRASLLIEKGLGTVVDSSQLFDASLGLAEPMAVGTDWCTNNGDDPQPATRRGAQGPGVQWQAELEAQPRAHPAWGGQFTAAER